MNNAQRVMDLGDEWHILASKDFMDWISKITTEYNEFFHFLGPRRVKHGDIIEIYNVYDDKSGNPKEPAKGKISLYQQAPFRA